MKVIVIGCTHAGTAAILSLKKSHPETDITVYERNDNISFLSCGIALYVGGVVKDPEGLFYCSPEKLSELGVVTRMKHDVLDIDFPSKKVTVKDLESESQFEDHYDKLIITTGSWPIIPGIPGINLKNILVSKNYAHAQSMMEATGKSSKIAIIGAGYIGVELAEAFRSRGKSVLLMDASERILSKYLDKHFTDILEERLREKGIDLALGQKVTGFEGENGFVKAVLTDHGRQEADLVILCIGFKPNTALFKGKLDMLPNGAIIVDKYMQTSQKDVFSAGDCCAVFYNPSGRNEYIPLATNAVRMGTLTAKNLFGPSVTYMGTQGTSGIKIYDYHVAATGLTEEGAFAAGFEAQTSLVVDNYRPEFMPDYEPVHLKVVYEKGSGRILGAQILSKAELTQSINALSICIQNKMTIGELAFVDFFFQPNYNKPWNFLNTAGLNVQ